MATIESYLPRVLAPHAAQIPIRKESYTTWLYLGLAVTVAVLTVFGMWYAGLPR
jgi:hypothetical protein